MKKALSIGASLLLLLFCVSCGSGSYDDGYKAGFDAGYEKGYETALSEINDTKQIDLSSTSKNISSSTEKNISNEVTYIGNKNSNVFHKPTCSSVKQMKESNKDYRYDDRSSVIADGYRPCKKCNP